jgi:hypothetical protein
MPTSRWDSPPVANGFLGRQLSLLGRAMTGCLLSLAFISPTVAWVNDGPGAVPGWQQTSYSPAMSTAVTSTTSGGADTKDMDRSDLTTGVRTLLPGGAFAPGSWPARQPGIDTSTKRVEKMTADSPPAGTAFKAQTRTILKANAPPPAPPSTEFKAQTWVVRTAPPGPMADSKVLSNKHSRGAIHPATGKVYINGGDYRGLPQPDGTWVSASQSGRQEMFSYDIGTHSAELLQHYCRLDGGLQPSSHDEFMWVWVEPAQRFWAPFGYQWSSTLCPGNTAGPVQYDPATRTWEKLTIPPPPRLSATAHANHAMYDVPSDVLHFVSRTGNGALAMYRYSRVQGVWLPTIARPQTPTPFPNMKINDTLPAHDSKNRAIYVVSIGKAPALYRYAIATEKWEDLGPIPNLTGPVQVETFPVYDTVSDVLLFPHTYTDGTATHTVALHAFKYATKMWTPQPMPAERVVARNGIFSEQHNVLMLWGWSGKLWFYRYAERP